MAVNPLARKLLITPGNRLLVLNGPADWLPRLGPLPDGVEVAEGLGGPADVIHLFVSRKVEWTATPVRRWRPLGPAACCGCPTPSGAPRSPPT